MKCFFRNNGLSLLMLTLFLCAWVGQVGAGRLEYNDDRVKQRKTTVGYLEYLKSAHFGEATAENWESEFLQMGVFVLATVFLYQKGSAESKDPRQSGDNNPRKVTSRSPWPVRRGGWIFRLYRHSLSLALFGFFLMSFAWHAAAGQRLFNEERAKAGEASVTLLDYLQSSRFWFESFQNWQSEFLSIGVIVVLSIWLREVDSSQSKSLETPYGENEA